MANLRDIVMTDVQVMGSDRAILAQIIENFEYENGKKTDKKNGYKYRVACYCKNFEIITVKIDSLTPISITQSELEERNSQQDFVYVTFEGFEGKLWQDSSKQVKISASANKIILFGEDY